jgi:hypothetical protein
VNYLKIDGNPVSVFDICQAHAQLESDYNVDGWVRERPSNQRRKESTSCQLARMCFSDAYRWVDITAERDEGDDPGDDDVRFIYLYNVMKWGLPADAEMKAAIHRTFVRRVIEQYPAYL